MKAVINTNYYLMSHVLQQNLLLTIKNKTTMKTKLLTKTQKKMLKQAAKECLKGAIVAFLTALVTILSSCGVTKATISKPAEGTSTTITITTNNPMTTNVNPNVELKK